MDDLSSPDDAPLPQWIVQAVHEIVTAALDLERADALTLALTHPNTGGFLPSAECARIVALAHVMMDTTPQHLQGERGCDLGVGRAALAHIDPLHKDIDRDEWMQWTQAMTAVVGSKQFSDMLDKITPQGAGGSDVAHALIGLIDILVHGAHLNYDLVSAGARILTKHALTGYFRPLMGLEDNWMALGQLIPRCALGSDRSAPPIYLNAVQAKKMALATGIHYFQSAETHNAYSFFLNEKQVDVAGIVTESTDQLISLFEHYLSDDIRVPVLVRMERMHHQIDALSDRLEHIAPEPAVVGWRKTRLELPPYAVTEAIVAECTQMVVLTNQPVDTAHIASPARTGQRI